VLSRALSPPHFESCCDANRNLTSFRFLCSPPFLLSLLPCFPRFEDFDFSFRIPFAADSHFSALDCSRRLFRSFSPSYPGPVLAHPLRCDQCCDAIWFFFVGIGCAGRLSFAFGKFPFSSASEFFLSRLLRARDTSFVF